MESKMAGVDGLEPSDAFSFKEKRAASTLHPNEVFYDNLNIELYILKSQLKFFFLTIHDL